MRVLHLTLNNKSALCHGSSAEPVPTRCSNCHTHLQTSAVLRVSADRAPARPIDVLIDQ